MQIKLTTQECALLIRTIKKADYSLSDGEVANGVLDKICDALIQTKHTAIQIKNLIEGLTDIQLLEDLEVEP